MKENGRPPNLTVAVSLLVVVEMMFFAGLVSAYLVTRAKAEGWPPVGQPRLPVASTAVNTLVLLFSARTLQWSIRQLSREWLGATWVLGWAFVAMQGREWVNLLNYGLTVRSGVYGAFFYTLVGAHALHVLAGLAVLAWVHHRFSQGRLNAWAIYWWFVVALWPILYLLVYLL
ncbi:cytochrome c oxidase subunit 3 [bacterium]|nr:cytochrome c oxidase subunit 3 [bacterium]